MTPLSTPAGLTNATTIITTDDSFMGLVGALNNALGLAPAVADEHDFTLADAVHHALGSGRMYVDDFTRLMPAIVPPVGFEAGRVALETDALGGGIYSGRHWFHTGLVWTSWRSNRIQYARETGVVVVASPGGGAFVDFDAANLNLIMDMCDGVTRPDDLEWAYRCRFNGAFQSDAACGLEVRIMNTTDGEMVAYSGMKIVVPGGAFPEYQFLVSLDAIYQPAGGADAARTFRVQVRTSVPANISRAIEPVLGVGSHTHEVSEIAV